ncbi:MAG: hypothetical protein H0X44_01820 [Acidobacteria bacterium]|nr:hypothetical protein [Acidobacteriota bacterium]
MRDREDTPPGVARLAGLRPALLDLHKTLLDWQRAEYEREHGRQSGSELLQLLLSHPQFEWLRAISALVVRIDEELEADASPAGELDALVDTVRATIAVRDVLSPFGQRYEAALQDSPDAIFAHKRVTELLGPRRG